MLWRDREFNIIRRKTDNRCVNERGGGSIGKWVLQENEMEKGKWLQILQVDLQV